jgi:hypothetical protein
VVVPAGGSGDNPDCIQFMLQNIKDLYGSKLAAADGAIGHVKDFYFDDKTWVIRYVVADTGSWLTGRLVLLSPHAFGQVDRSENTLHVKLHKQQIQDSPSIDSHQPISRQYEVAYYNYYGWPAYWNGSAVWGLGDYPVVLPPSKAQMEAHLHPDPKDRHLQSTRAITDYAIQAVDGPIGHLSGLKMDDRSWAIRDLVVEAGHWYSGKEILIAPAKVERISYEESTIFVNLTKADIQRTAEHELVKAGA